MAKVLITGGSGLVGNRLTRLLLEQGNEVVHLGRTSYVRKDGVPVFKWDYQEGTLDNKALEGVETIVHLAGAGVADKKWTSVRKQEIMDSRVLTAQLLYNVLVSQNHSVKAIISASAVGWYGDGDGQWQKEEQASGTGFLADTCRKWEAAILPFSRLGIRVCRMRIGIVLSAGGGALPQMDRPLRFGIGAYLGNGRQYFPWIHIDDVCEIFIMAIKKQDMQGAFNTVAPNPVTVRDFTKEIAAVLKKPIVPFPVPAFALRLTMGEMADMLLFSNRASADKVVEAGYVFHFPDLHTALCALYGK